MEKIEESANISNGLGNLKNIINLKMNDLNDEKNLRCQLLEVDKMDAILKMKATEEKDEKLKRIQAEEEIRRILQKLNLVEASNAVKMNSQRFLSLLGDTLLDESPDREEPINGKEYVNEPKQRESQPKSGKEATFIERNIQLAKCGRGVLSLTDEENLRVQALLKDCEDIQELDETEETKATEPSEILYGLDEDTKTALNEIDEKLEAYSKSKSLHECESKLSLFGTDFFEDSDSSDEKKKKTKRNRLKEINKLLNCINSVSEEEIQPLPLEDIQILLKEGMQNVKDCDLPSDKEGLSNTEFSPKIISELVSSAQTLMPNFKYRYDY